MEFLGNIDNDVCDQSPRNVTVQLTLMTSDPEYMFTVNFLQRTITIEIDDGKVISLPPPPPLFLSLSLPPSLPLSLSPSLHPYHSLLSPSLNPYLFPNLSPSLRLSLIKLTLTSLLPHCTRLIIIAMLFTVTIYLFQLKIVPVLFALHA